MRDIGRVSEGYQEVVSALHTFRGGLEQQLSTAVQLRVKGTSNLHLVVNGEGDEVLLLEVYIAPEGFPVQLVYSVRQQVGVTSLEELQAFLHGPFLQDPTVLGRLRALRAIAEARLCVS